MSGGRYAWPMRHALVVVLLAASACANGGAPGAAGDATPGERIAVSAWEGEPSSLLGLTRAAIEAKFGPASTCEPWGGEVHDPCQSARDWFYSADHSTRGGKVLLLRFDDADAAGQSSSARCVVARFESTK